MEARISLIFYFYILTSFNANLVSPLLHTANGCDAFPQSMRFLCYKIENLWATGAETTKTVNMEEERADALPLKLILSSHASETNKKPTGMK